MAKTRVSSDQIRNQGLFSEIYTATGKAAAGEFVNTVRKTFDITSIPEGSPFIVIGRNYSGDQNARNTIVGITYNGEGISSDVFTTYHINASVTVPFIKIAGANSVTISYGGSGASQSWYAKLQQMG